MPVSMETEHRDDNVDAAPSVPYVYQSTADARIKYSFCTAFWAVVAYSLYTSDMQSHTEEEWMMWLRYRFFAINAYVVPFCGISFAGLGLFVAGKQLSGSAAS
jgi:hypothetical protein